LARAGVFRFAKVDLTKLELEYRRGGGGRGPDRRRAKDWKRKFKAAWAKQRFVLPKDVGWWPSFTAVWLDDTHGLRKKTGNT